ncbi:hypothetical protein KSD_53700 [Ktedonobacter sp. SOSP1-85]|nr:hypothetical protein KSD_53700 [Ktedonobacter sp. SOSP1-85]
MQEFYQLYLGGVFALDELFTQNPDLTYRASMGQGKDGLGRGWRRKLVRWIYTVA